jgi:hypothetical protein
MRLWRVTLWSSKKRTFLNLSDDLGYGCVDAKITLGLEPIGYLEV